MLGASFVLLTLLVTINPVVSQAGQRSTPQPPPQPRPPAYLSNAYFSDAVNETTDGVIRPLSVVKALRNQPSGRLGYLILDMVLVRRGRHTFRVEISNQQRQTVGTLNYPSVKTAKQGALPLYTAASPISGHFSAGLWFFKVLDQVDNGTWNALGTLAVVVVDPTKRDTKNGHHE